METLKKTAAASPNQHGGVPKKEEEVAPPPGEGQDWYQSPPNRVLADQGPLPCVSMAVSPHVRSVELLDVDGSQGYICETKESAELQVYLPETPLPVGDPATEDFYTQMIGTVDNLLEDLKTPLTQIKKIAREHDELFGDVAGVKDRIAELRAEIAVLREKRKASISVLPPPSKRSKGEQYFGDVQKCKNKEEEVDSDSSVSDV